MSTGFIEVKGSLPKSAYASEDIAPLKIEIINHSNSPTCLMEIFLAQSVAYKTPNELSSIYKK